MKKILFLCTGNACRSQIAEGWAKHFHKDLEVYSAGIFASGLDLRAQMVMMEAGVDIGNQYSKTVETIQNLDFDYVFTVCSHADQHCPTWPAKVKKIHKNFGDPAHLALNKEEDEQLKVFRKTRDDIKEFVKNIKDYF